MSAEPRVMTRDELYDLVWSKPMTRIAAELGISDVMLGKLCRKLDVPRPPRGYWRKVTTGQRVPKSALPRARKGLQSSMTIYPQPPSPPKPAIAPNIAERLAAERQETNKIVVPDCLETPHVLVERARHILAKTRANDEGLSVAPASRSCLNIQVSPGSLERALRIMNTLIHALERRGYAVSLAADKGGTWVLTPEGRVQLRLTETVDRIETEQYRAAKASNPYVFLQREEKWIFKPTGRFKLTAIDEDGDKRKLWNDSPKRPLEQRLNRVIAGIILAAENCRLHRIELAEARRKREEEEQRRIEQAHRRRELERLAKMFEEQATQWSRCEGLRAFLQACEHSLTAARGVTALTRGSAEDMWLRWASEYVQHLDPLLNGAVTQAIREVASSTAVRESLNRRQTNSEIS